MSDNEAADVPALIAVAQAGATSTDIYGWVWVKVLADVGRDALALTDTPAITIPDGIPDIS